MTTALYRRYRPDTFQDVIGQEHVTAPLMAALRADRVTHAYLFSGPRGCGKTTSARILARCLNCEQYPTDTPCGQCPSCRDLATGGPGSLDVVEIDAASHNGVDDARDLRERAAFAPARDRFKIFILDEAHMVTPQGFNALLKLVEEPPAHVKFIFATTEPEKVIGTIRSRTHHYPFRLVAPDVLEAYLDQLCQAEGVQVGPGVFPLVTRAGGGSVRDTLSVMDQLIGGAVDGEIDYQRAVALLGYTDATLLDECVDAIAAADGAGVFRVVDQVVSSGHDPRRFVEDLLQRLRDLLVIALAGQEAGPALGSVPADQLARMEVQARTLGSGALSRYADLTAQALTGMVGATSPRLQLELLMARLLVPLLGGSTPQPASVPQVSSGVGRVGQPAGSGAAGALGAQGAQAGGTGTGGTGVPDHAGRAGAGGGAAVDPRALAAQIAQQAGAVREGHADGERAAAGQPGGGLPASGGAGGAWAEPGGERRAGGAEPVPGAVPVQPASGLSPVPAEPASGQGRPAAGQSLPAAGAASGAQPSSGAGQAVSQPQQGAAEAQMIRSRWAEVLDAAKRSRRATWALVEQHAQPGALRDGVFQILFTAPGLVGAFENGGHGPVLSEAIHQALGLQVECHALLAGGPGGGGAGPAGAGPVGGSGPSGVVTPPAGQVSASGGAAGASASASAAGRQGGGRGVRAPAPAHGEQRGAGAQPQVPGAHSARREQRSQAARSQSDSAAPGSEADGDPHPAAAPTGQVAAPDASPDAGEARAGGYGPGGERRADQPPAAQGAVTGPARSVAAGPAAAPGQSAAPAVVGWGEVAQVGRARHAEPASAEPDATGVPEPGGRGAASPAVQPAEASGGAGAVPGDGASQAGQGDDVEGGLAPVRRLHPLPQVPAGGGGLTVAGLSAEGQDTAAAAGPAEMIAPDDATAPDGAPGPDGDAPGTGPEYAPRSTGGRAQAARVVVPAQTGTGAGGAETAPGGVVTFSDGVPLPEEPGDPDGPVAPFPGRGPAGSGPAGGSNPSGGHGGADGPDGPAGADAWAPPSASVAKAMAAARAAAAGHALPQEPAGAGPAGRVVSLEDDVPSEDDEDAEDAGVVGLEVVKRILGATVLEDVIINPEDH